MNELWRKHKENDNNSCLSDDDDNMRNAVYDAVSNQWPELYHGTNEVDDNKSKKKHVLQQIKINVDSSRYNDAIQFFAILIEIGNKQGSWRITIPPYHQVVRRERSPFTSYSFKNNEYAHILNNLIKKKLSSLDFNEKIGKNNLSILILLSSIINGGVLTKERIAGVCGVNESMIRSESGLICLDIDIDSRSLIRGKLAKKSASNYIWRWYPDSMTSFLLLLWKKQTDTSLIDGFQIKKDWDKSVLTKVNDYLKSNNYVNTIPPLSIGTLIEWGKSHLSFHVPGFLVKYASGSNISSSLMPLAYARVLTNRAGIISTYEESQEKEVKPEIITSNISVRPDICALEEKILKTIKPLIHAARKDNNKVLLAKLIKNELNKHNLVPKSLFYVVVNWILHMLENNTTSRNRVKITSIYEYVCALAPRLVSYGSGIDIIMSKEDQFLELYGSVLADCSSINRIKFVSSRIREFHNYMRDKHGAVKINFNDIEGFMVGEGIVSANVITPHEYDNILKLLRPKSPVSQRGFEIRALIVMLGFRLGLRLGEVLRLTLKDISFGKNGEIYIQPNVYGRLKTRNARRRLPLGILVTEDERDWLKQWHALRLKETKDNSNALLFTLEPIQNSLIRMDVILPDIHTAMRQVTGDESVRYHIFRHSFANWMLIKLISTEIPNAIDSRIATYNNASFSKNECARLKKFFFSQGYIQKNTLHPVRSALYQLAQMMGHSSPGITLKHYVHICDYLLGKSLPNNLNCITAESLMKLINIKKSSAYNYINLLKADENNEHKFLNKIATWANVKKYHVDLELTMPNLTPLFNEKKNDKIELQANSIVEMFKDIWSVAEIKPRTEQSDKSKKIVIEGIIKDGLTILAEQKDIELSLLKRWYRAAVDVHKKHTTRTTIATHYRLSLLPNLKRGINNDNETKRILALLIHHNETNRKKVIENGVKKYLSSVSEFSSNVNFNKFSGALEYLEFLGLLGIDKKQIKILYLGKINSSNSREQSDLWEKELGMPVKYSKNTRSRSIKASNIHGSVEIYVESSAFSKKTPIENKKNSISRLASSSFRCAIHLFEILRVKNTGLDVRTYRVPLQC